MTHSVAVNGTSGKISYLFAVVSVAEFPGSKLSCDTNCTDTTMYFTLNISVNDQTLQKVWHNELFTCWTFFKVLNFFCQTCNKFNKFKNLWTIRRFCVFLTSSHMLSPLWSWYNVSLCIRYIYVMWSWKISLKAKNLHTFAKLPFTADPIEIGQLVPKIQAVEGL